MGRVGQAAWLGGRRLGGASVGGVMGWPGGLAGWNSAGESCWTAALSC